MKQRLIAILLTVALLLSLCGCTAMTQRGLELLQEMDEKAIAMDNQPQQSGELPAYDELVYERPDPDELWAAVDEVKAALDTGDADDVMDALDAFYSLYWGYYGMYTIAIIESDADVEDDVMWEEYVYCTDISWEIDEAVNAMLTACAASDLKEVLEKEYYGEGSLDGYSGEYTLDPVLQDLYLHESDLVEEYLQLHGQMSQHSGGDDFYELYATDAAELFIELIQVRNSQAMVLGYDSYAEMMYSDICFDYTPEQLMTYFEELQQYMVPVYRQQIQNGAYDNIRLTSISPEEAFDCTTQFLMDRDVAGISTMLEKLVNGGYYNVEESAVKRDTTYAIYIDSVDMPFLFLSPEGDTADCLSIAHELGHCDDMHLNYDTTYSTDISETLSQGMEYLYLCQEDAPYRDELLRYKLLESLDSDLYTAALSVFEHRAYALPEEELTPERLHQLYAEVSADFGMYDTETVSDESWIYVDHVFQYPFYLSSYSVSDTAAFHFYLMELEDPQSGENAYMDLQWNAPDYAFVEVLTMSGLPSPFEEGQVAAQARTIAQTLHELEE